MPPVGAIDAASVAVTNPHSVFQEDYVEMVADYRVSFDSLAGAWTSYEVCNKSMRLSVRRIHLTPNHHDGVAILQSPGPPGCEFALVVLISKQRVAVLRHEWSQVP